MWTLEDVEKTYHIGKWGQGYFTVNKKGHLAISPSKSDQGPIIDFMDVIEEMQKQQIKFPAVIRFHDILRAQVISLNKTFQEVIEEAQYKGRYQGVYPIKVNQTREVVEEILDAGEPYNYGLEAGSKTELMAVLAYNTNPNALTILNGYKDKEYLQLALLGRQLGRKVIVVIEKFSELVQLIELSKAMGVEPLIGIRAKLGTQSAGKWANSSGDFSKFGLSTSEIISAINLLQSENLLGCFKLFHFHIGSQIPDIRILKDAISEGARIYAKLAQLHAPIEYFDVGGGLGVDYDGTKSVLESSTNYGMREYISDVVYILKQVCDLENVEHPHIVTESGRAITAHHSCIVSKVFGTIRTTSPDFPTHSRPGEHILVKNIRDQLENLTSKNCQEVFNDAIQIKEDAFNAFKLGVLGLEERAKIETLYWKICEKINLITKDMEELPLELSQIQKFLSEQYLCNFSVFQSTADSWAINQVLPVSPISRLLEPPTVSCTLADITCDSDGRIKQYISPDTLEVGSNIVLHPYDGKDYFVGIFMTGAYQDIMGDMHNLFGRVNEVHVFSDDEDPEDFYIEEYIPGNTSEEILKTMQYNPEYMAITVKKSIDRQVKRGKIKPREGVMLSDFYEHCLKSYTYLHHQ